MNQQKFLVSIKNTFQQAEELIKRKNADYANDVDPFLNFRMSSQVGVDPARGILVRISDKITRISNLLDREAQVKDESIRDSIKDAINYLAILQALLEEKEEGRGF